MPIWQLMPTGAAGDQETSRTGLASAGVAEPAGGAGTPDHVTDRDCGVLRSACDPQRLTPPAHIPQRLYRFCMCREVR